MNSSKRIVLKCACHLGRSIVCKSIALLVEGTLSSILFTTYAGSVSHDVQAQHHTQSYCFAL